MVIWGGKGVINFERKLLWAANLRLEILNMKLFAKDYELV